MLVEASSCGAPHPLGRDGVEEVTPPAAFEHQRQRAGVLKVLHKPCNVRVLQRPVQVGLVPDADVAALVADRNRRLVDDLGRKLLRPCGTKPAPPDQTETALRQGPVTHKLVAGLKPFTRVTFPVAVRSLKELRKTVLTDELRGQRDSQRLREVLDWRPRGDQWGQMSARRGREEERLLDWVPGRAERHSEVGPKGGGALQPRPVRITALAKRLCDDQR
mmetsp:Transcript_19353/g.58207  ORF Transcript_19353/g.58207 Transcript_19353/m.58207 type:complete len:219 (+) Transcript_19353:763-1419(+)